MITPAYYCGEYSEFNKIRVPLFDRSIFFADAVYDVAIGMNGRIYQLDEHMERLKNSAEALRINLPSEFKMIREIAENLLSSFSGNAFLFYVQLSRCSPKREHYVEEKHKTALLAFVDAIDEFSRDKIRLSLADDLRYKLCNVKTINLLPAVLSSINAPFGVAETVYLRNGNITECSHSNIFIYKNGVLCTPPVGEGVLGGITRMNILRIADKTGIPTEQKSFTSDELYSADGAYVSSTTKFLRMAESIDNVKLSCNDKGVYAILYDKLFSDFEQFVYG